MNIPIFDNQQGEGIVSFEPWKTSGPEYRQDQTRWYCHLTIAGKRIYEYGSPCGTCGIVFRKVGNPSHRLNDAESVELLGDLNDVPSKDVIEKLARVLAPGVYHPFVLEGTVRLISPGAEDDYFATDVVRMSGLEPPEFQSPSSPMTFYYRFGSDHVLAGRTGRLGGPHKALVTAVAMPLHDSTELDRERIEYWKHKWRHGTVLTAFAISVLDDQSPAMKPVDQSYPYEEQLLLSLCILDGHHRIQAAAEIGERVRILTLLSKDFSLHTKTEDILSVIDIYLRKTV
jgi:hypothetical protein